MTEMISEPKFVMFKSIYGSFLCYPLYNYFTLAQFDDGHFEIFIKEDVGEAAEYDNYDICEEEYNRLKQLFITLSSPRFLSKGDIGVIE